MARRKSFLALAAVAALLWAFISPVNSPVTSEALSGSDFQPGYIISDENFFASFSLNQGEIQDFLRAKGSPCQAGYTCLSDYTQRTTSIPADSFCSGYLGSSLESAAAILAKTAVSCGISPKVLLVLLQKEQGLVTRSDPAAWRYNAATGMGCPDTAACDPTVSGFFFQVFYAARAFKKYIALNSSFGYHWGQNNSIQFNPNAACGSQNVFIQNQATAALYIYTPYVPSAAALADLYGTGSDPSCSAYGNRNFWRYFNDWFGSPTGNSPIVSLDSYEILPGKIHIRGWALDLDTSNPIQIHAYFNNVGIPIVANIPRPDLATNLPLEYRIAGTTHGFDAEIPVPASGPLNICLYAINFGSGENIRFDCRSTPPLSGSPIGSLDSVTVQGHSVTVSGWAFDPDTSGFDDIHVYAGGRPLGVTTASNQRSDLTQLALPQGGAHGFQATFLSPAGVQNICAYGINVSGRGENTLLNCQVVNVSGGSPQGTVDSITQIPGAFVITGWAYQPWYSGTTPLHVYVNGSGNIGSNGLSRPDVRSVYTSAPLTSGYSVTVPAKQGMNSICIYAIDQLGVEDNKQLSCRTLNGLAGDPFGAVDSVTATRNTISATGWVIDPDIAGDVNVHLYLDGRPIGVATTTTQRPDVRALFPQYQVNRGYSATASNLNITPGTHQLCVYGINLGQGSNSLLKCQPIIIN